jgi:hypothetical protein
MSIRIRWALGAGALLLGCGSTLEGQEAAAPVATGQREAAQAAITALQQGDFPEAERLAGERVAQDGGNPYPRLVRAIAHYKRSMQQLVLDGRTVVVGGAESGTINQKYLRQTLGEGEAELAAVEADLAVAARRSGLSLELCLACWDLDWNGNGRIDDRDRRLLEIEEDADGHPLPEGDPRRRPTFRFDDGDLAWARAFVSFERAALDVLLAYDWTEAAGFARRRRERPTRVVIRLVEPARIAAAKQRLLEGLAQSDACRRAYLAETDDDREWVPSPRQRSHPLPLPVDQALYDTWEGVVGDVRRLAQGDEGLPIAELMAVAGEGMREPVRGSLDLGGMLSHPRDIVLDLAEVRGLAREHDAEGAMKSLFGDYYRTDIKPSPLAGRLQRMKGEVDRGQEGLSRKLRYLFWLN